MACIQFVQFLRYQRRTVQPFLRIGLLRGTRVDAHGMRGNAQIEILVKVQTYAPGFQTPGSGKITADGRICNIRILQIEDVLATDRKPDVGERLTTGTPLT